MSRRLPTIRVSGGQYAKVADRLRLFREDNPNGVIITSFERNDAAVVFTATIKKENNETSGFAVAHSLGNLKDSKSFEKLETVAVGRALALLGYIADGEIASFEEIEQSKELEDEKGTDEQKSTATQQLRNS